MKRIPLSQGKVAIIDDRDYALVSLLKWHANSDRRGGWYARATIRPVDSKSETCVLMHRLILNFRAETIDHINGNGLDNRRKNLRLASWTENKQNSRLSLKNTSGFRELRSGKPPSDLNGSR